MRVSRRDAMKQVAAAGAVALGAAGTAAGQQRNQTDNRETPIHSKAAADEPGPQQLFAVVDADGKVRRGRHVTKARRLGLGLYEVEFQRDVRRGVYLATIGGHGYEGLPPTGYVSVVGRSINPRSVLVSTAGTQGDPAALPFHLLVVCPEGYAGAGETSSP
jgi:hypothetical protein